MLIIHSVHSFFFLLAAETCLYMTEKKIDETPKKSVCACTIM